MTRGRKPLTFMGLTVAQIAPILGLKYRAALYRVSGERPFSPEQIEKLARHAGLTDDEVRFAAAACFLKLHLQDVSVKRSEGGIDISAQQHEVSKS